MIINKKNICTVVVLFLSFVMNAMINNKTKDNSNKIIKRHYRNVPQVYKFNNKYAQQQYKQLKKHKNRQTKTQYKLNQYVQDVQDLNNYYFKSKNKITEITIRKEQTDYDSQKEEFDKRNNNQSSQQQSPQKNLKVYIAGFAVGVGAILHIVSNNLYEEGTKKKQHIYDILCDFVLEDKENRFNIQFQNLTGISFSEYQKLFLDPMDISVKNFVRIVLYERSIGNSVENIVFSFIKELKQTENKQRFVKLLTPLMYSSVKDDAPGWYHTFGLIDPLSRNFAESFYKYLTSEQGVEYIKQICSFMEKDIEHLEKVAYFTTHVTVGTVFSILVNNVILPSAIKRGGLRTFLLSPTPFIPVALAIELYRKPQFANKISSFVVKHKDALFKSYNYYQLENIHFSPNTTCEDLLTSVANLDKGISPFIVKHKDILFKFYNYYQLENLDPSQSIAYEDLPSAAVLNSYEDARQKIQYNIDNVYIPLAKEFKESVLSTKNDKRRVLEAGASKITEVVTNQAKSMKNTINKVLGN